MSVPGKPWLYVESEPYDYCFVPNYQCDGAAFAVWDWECMGYLFDDGDSYKPEKVADMAGVQFFDSHLLLSLLEPHFRNQKASDEATDTREAE